MTAVRSWLRTALSACGYTGHRWPANRFDAMEDALVLLRRRAYAPRIIIDAGANVGDWSGLARAVFGRVETHVIEPQRACHAALEAMAGRTGGVTVHPVAVTEPGVSRVRMIGGGPQGGGTGAKIARPDEQASQHFECPATTLDMLLAERVTRADRALLKLDLEGHEVVALRGAGRLLEAVEVLVSEVQFYEIGETGRPRIAELVSALSDRGFELYDVASLSGRARDRRLRLGDLVFVHRASALCADRSWA